MNEILKKVSDIGLVPVIKIDDPDDAVPLARALAKGGLPVAEITFRTAQAEESIKRIAKELPEVILGAGTVLTTEQVDRAVAAGAKFIVSPGLNPKIVKYCVDKNIPITPGCANPSDVEQAIELGLEVVKFFPAEQAGGLAMIKAMAAPYVNMKFMPTGGVNEKNLNQYLAFDKIVACGGSFMVKDELVKAKQWDEITKLTQAAVDLMLGFEIAHVGVNAQGENDALAIANAFANLFNMPVKNGNSSVFAGTAVEVMKENGRGKNGHIAIRTNYINRAVAYLKTKGIQFDEASAKKNDKGVYAAIYFKDDIGGFAVHLVQKS